MENIGRIKYESNNADRGVLVNSLILMEFLGNKYGFLPKVQGEEVIYARYMHEDISIIEETLKRRGYVERAIELKDFDTAREIFESSVFSEGRPSKELTKELIKLIGFEK